MMALSSLLRGSFIPIKLIFIAKMNGLSFVYEAMLKSKNIKLHLKGLVILKDLVMKEAEIYPDDKHYVQRILLSSKEFFKMMASFISIEHAEIIDFDLKCEDRHKLRESVFTILCGLAKVDPWILLLDVPQGGNM
jgi:hypothetical protein